jgi:uncharacterized protein YabN with tetrapyrrole methylase and pyrophosphatase domain
MGDAALKAQERGAASLLEGAPRSMPALAYAQTVSRRAARAGFEWDDLDGALGKAAEELRELEQARDAKEREQELGDALFALVVVARWLEVDAESALREANGRFSRRFAFMEEACRQRGVTLAALPLSQKLALWAQAKPATHTRRP